MSYFNNKICQNIEGFFGNNDINSLNEIRAGQAKEKKITIDIVELTFDAFRRRKRTIFAAVDVLLLAAPVIKVTSCVPFKIQGFYCHSSIATV